MAASVAKATNEGRDGKTWAWKSKSEHAKKMQLLKDIDQLEQKILGMDREKNTHLYNKRSEFRKVFCVLEEAELKLNNERKTEKVKVKLQIDKMRSSVGKFQRELKDIKPTPEFVEKLKETMEDIEGSMNAFKERQKEIYEELMKEELSVSQEVVAMEKRFESWAQVPPIVIDSSRPSSKAARPLSSARNIIADMPPEVAAFERFLQQTGGHRGGWDEYDHQTFLKFRNRHKGRPSFLDVALNSLPGRTILQVKQHENWYHEYLALLDKKKIGIQKWKTQKKAEKDELISKVGEDEIESSDDEETKQRKTLQMEKEKIEKLEKLNAWKVQKELERMQEEEKKMKEQLRQAQERERERKRQLAVKSRVREYAQQRKEEEEDHHIEIEMRREMEIDQKRRFAEAEIARFQERDQRRLQEKQTKEKAKEKAWQKKQQQLEKLKGQVKVEVQRDPSRLYKLTEGWKERQKDSESSQSGPMLQIPHRSVPSWRSGL